MNWKPLAGAGIGGVVGQIFDAPRKTAWNLLGLPDTGTELVSNTFGMDPESLWTQALGLGAEFAGDPLTWMGGGIGKLLGRGGKAAAKIGNVADVSTVIDKPVVSASQRLRNLVPDLRQHMASNYDDYVAKRWAELAAQKAAREAAERGLPWTTIGAVGSGAGIGAGAAIGQRMLPGLLAGPEPYQPQEYWRPEPRPPMDQADRDIEAIYRDILQADEYQKTRGGW